MTQRPIREDAPTATERELLDAARLDAPLPSARARALATLGLLGASTITTSAGAAATWWPPGRRQAAWLALGAMGAALAIGGVEGLGRLAHRGGSVPANAAQPDAPGTTGVASPVAEPPRLPSAVGPPALPDAASMPASPAGRRARAAKGASVVPDLPPAGTSEPDLGAEVAALEEVRRELASGHATVSLDLLDAYDRRFSAPRLEPEARMLRLEALIASGRVDRATKLAGRMLAEQPESAYGQRVRSLLRDAAPKKP